MSRQFEFREDKPENLLEGLQQANIFGFNSIRRKNSKIPLICIRHGPYLISYQFDVTTDSWKFYWKENIFNVGDNFNAVDYPWFVGDILGTGSDLIVIRNQSGIKFLQPRDNPPGIDEIYMDTRSGSWGSYMFVLMGNFYSDKSIFGMFRRGNEGNVQVYVIEKGALESRDMHPLRDLKNVQFSNSWKQSETKIFLTDFMRQGKDVFVLLTVGGLEIHEFNNSWKLTELIRTNTIRRFNYYDNLFFGHFISKKYKDIIHLNEGGLFLYRYDDEKKDFILLNHSMEFTANNGWRTIFADSIKILDINNDGTDELVFTGAYGLNVYSFNASLTKWENILNPSKLQGSLLYSKVIGLVKSSKISIFTQETKGKGALQSMTIIESKNITIQDDFEDAKKPLKRYKRSSILPPTISRMSHDEVPVLRWTEQWDDGFLKEAVRPQTGQVEFSIPLVKTGPVPALESTIGISYSSQDVSSVLLGIGWTIPIAEYYIAVDHKGSIFPVDYDYYLIREGRRAKLIVKKNNVNSTEFEIKEQPSLKIKYDMDGEKWFVGNDIEEIIFGISDDKKSGVLQIELNWQNWKGSGTDTSKLEQYIHAWYLCERRFLKADLSVFYKYETSSASISGKAYTTSIRLVSISDSKDKFKSFEINFDYSPKSEQEFKNLSPVTVDKIVTFPLQLVHTHYLKSFNVQTSTYQQRLDFDYQFLNGKRLLVQISQPMKGHTETIFKFDYKNEVNNFVMSTCKFLEKVLLTFDYTKTTSLIPPFSLQYSVKEPPQVKFGPDYAIMGYKLKGEVEFRLTNLALTTPIFKGTTFKEGYNVVVQSFVIKAFHNSFVIMQKTGFQIDAFTFTKANEWSDTPSMETFHQQSVMCYGETFYAIAEPNTKKLIIIERDFGRNEWKRFVLDVPGREIKRLETQNHMIVGHDGNHLILFYKKEHNKWTTDVIDRDVIFQSTEETISLFDIDNETKKEIISIFDREKLQVFNNMIVATSLAENDASLMIIAKLYLLDSNYKIAKTFVEKIGREKLLDIKLEKEVGGTNFILKYSKSNNKYRMKIVDFTGKLLGELDNISNKNKRENEKNDRLSALNRLDGWNKFFTKSIIFDPTLYRVQLCKDGLFMGDDNFLRITGVEWKKESRPSKDYVLLGESFILGFDQKDTKSVYLYYQQLDGKAGELIQNIKLHRPGQFINRYPAYLGYHLTAEKVTILTFKDPKTLGKEESYHGEELMFESNLTNLMTLAKVEKQGTTRYEWRVRSLSVFMEKKFYSIVEKWSITNDNISRTTAYERTSKYKRDEGILEENLRIIPGGNKSVSGWIEHIMVNNMETSERTTTTNFYNALGNRVSSESDNANDAKEFDVDVDVNAESKEDSKTLATSQIFDRSGHMEISNFAPYKVDDDEGVYLGFEVYEESQGMEFDVASIIRGKFAFTGDSYLNLQRNQKLTKILKPKDTNNIFIASCYIRTSSTIKLNSEAKYLRVLLAAQNMQTKEILSKIVRQSGEWFYLESHINLITLNRQHGQLQGLQITIEVTTGSAKFLDLDHIRFSPLTQNFEAAIFNPNTGKVTSKIMDNGLVSRTIFDRHDREIAAIKSNGNIEYFTRATKTGELIPPPRTSINKQPSSQLKIEPESGFYEHFDATAFLDRWTVSDDRVWSISKGQLVHRGLSSDTIKVNANLINDSCAALRFDYNIRLTQSSLTLRWSSNISITFTSMIENQATLTLNGNRGTVVDSLPAIGELLIFIEVERIVVWVDGVLIIDQGHGYGDLTEPWSDFQFEIKNYLIIEDLLIMNRPRISLEYFNGLSEKVQALQFESDKVIQVSQTLYDELGRSAIVTKPTKITRDMYQTLFAFYPEFVQNDNPKDSNSVWNTGLLKGDVDTLNKNDSGVPYLRTGYDDNPLNEKISEGLPGPAHSVSGPHAKRFSNSLQVDFMNNLFPSRLGYNQQVQILPNGSKKVSVLDSKNNIVARYTQVVGFDHLLTTYEYNYNNKLVKVLPPLYHELAQTALKVTPWENGDAYFTEAEKKLQETYGTSLSYNIDGNLIEKRTPDTGRVKYMYALDGSLRFMVTIGPYNNVSKVVYFFYDEFKQLIRTGHLATPLSLAELEYYLHGAYGVYLPNAVDFQIIQYSDQSEDPMERGYMKMLVTYSGLEPVKEIIRFNNDFYLSSRSIYSLPQQISFDISSSMISIRKDYNGKKVSALTYPGIYQGKPFKLVYTYDKLGNVIALGTETNYQYFASFSYYINGLVSVEMHTPTSPSSFSRLFKYNSPGFLERITDPYLTEDVSYTHGGYGMNGFGDGTILLTSYNAKWANNVDHRQFRVNTIDENLIPAVCIDALKQLGYLDSLNNPKKMYIPAADISMPVKCRGDVSLKLAKLVGQNHIPLFYGFRFAYGSYMELTSGKYFTSETHRLIDPLQEHSFSQFIANISKIQSEEIFHILLRNKYILSVQRTDRGSMIGKKGKPFFRKRDLERDLSELNITFVAFTSVLISLFTTLITQKKSLSLDIFQKLFLKWHYFNSDTTIIKLLKANEEAKTIFNMLSRKHYMTQMAFEEDFINILSRYNNFLPQIVEILNHHFIHELGQTPFDVESYDIDSNGNHRMFYTGFERYKLTYKNGTNQIAEVKLVNYGDVDSEKTYKMAHDIDGNVVQALHKNIEEIEYNRTSQKPSSMRLTDGRKLMFYYDAQGERILKRVLSHTGTTAKDTYYIRDEQGRVLLEREIVYFSVSRSKVVTVTIYIYGPRSLIGFIRNDKFHSVITDHAGSTRLIIRDGQVVGAFDYLPYGKIMRLYNTNLKDLIAYRYTGQEFDEETGLYYYFGRLYDPEIGRFYQLDPQAQYYSPYKYAGNTQTSFENPDGDLSFDIMASLAIRGAYLGGSGANNRGDTAVRGFKDSGSRIGLINGGMTDALLPTSIASIGSVDTVALGAGGMYLTASAANGNWNSAEWKWDSPEIWNGMFQGFATGSVLPAHKFTQTFTTTAGQKTFFDVGSGSAAGIAYASDVMGNYENAAFWDSDLSNPDTWNSLLSGFSSGVGMPSNFVDVSRSFRQLAQTPNKLRSLLGKIDGTPTSFRGFAEILKDPKHPLYKVAVLSVSAYYYVGADVNGDFDMTKTFGTYQGALQDVFLGRDMNEKITTAFQSRKTPKPEMVDIIPYKEIDINRVRRFAKDETFDDDTYVSISSDQFSSMDPNQLIDSYNESIIASTSCGVPITFWPLNFLRRIKSIFHITDQSGEHKTKQIFGSSIPLTPPPAMSSEESCNSLPDTLSATPGLQFDEYKDNYSVLEMGDQWLANTNMQGNLMWAYLLIRKLFGYKRYESNRSKSQTVENTNPIEFDIQAYEIVNEFFKDAKMASISCGIEDIIHEIIDSGNLDYLVRAVKVKLMRYQQDDITKLLFDSLIGRNLNKICTMSSPKQAQMYKKLVEEKMYYLNNRLIACSTVTCETNIGQNSFSRYANNTNCKYPSDRLSIGSPLSFPSNKLSLVSLLNNC